jgi:uncharacterized membrane protein SirB2
MTNPVLAIHVTTALLSISGFIYRGILRFSGSEQVNRKWLKITPHVIDTVLIASAIILLVQASLDPLNTSWLLAKIIALVLYILLGLIAFRFASNRAIALLAWCVAILVFCYILAVAVTRNPLILF